MLYFPSDYTWGYNFPAFGSTVISFIDLSTAVTVTVVAFVCNGFCFVKIRNLHAGISAGLPQQELQRRQREKKLFIQFFIMSLNLIILDLAFNLFPRFWDGKWVGLVTSLLNISQFSINAYANVGMNSVIRSQIAGFCKKTPKTTSVVVIVMKTQKFESGQSDRGFGEGSEANFGSVPNMVAEA